GLPGETAQHNRESLRRVTALGTDGLKLHPLHVVKGTQLANSWRNGQYTPLTMHEYIQIAADLVEQAPDNIVWHRLTGTAAETILLTPAWCALKWQVLNGIARELQRRRQSCRNVA
ncbi:MAG: TIGR01212 family radical SAM protein, partial [Candidatus Thiodiazotropha taylori]|nr:TIGR01212 family radical SAM protein [Candidatus Thiodiazotropha taylori]